MEKKISIFCEQKNLNFLKLIKKQLGGELDKTKNSKHYSLILKIDNKKLNLFKEIFAEAIISHYKHCYLNNNILLDELKPELRLALIKALTQFDSDLDKQIIVNRLNKIDKTIFVESFLMFYVPEFEARLNELCALANNNKAHFIMSETFNELFKFILTNLNFNGEQIFIHKKQDDIIIENSQNKEIFKAKENNELILILKIVEILPCKITITVPRTESKALSLVCKLFNNYVNFKNV